MIADLFFYLFAFVLVMASVLTVTVRQPVHAVLFLILVFFNAAGLFLTLGAEFLAFILLIVYVGAVAVLFLFVVMMLDSHRLAEPVPVKRRFDPVGIGVGGVLLAQIVALVALWPKAAAPVAQETAEGVTNTLALGRVLYTDFAFPFQVAGVILLVAIVGAITLTLGPRRAIRRQNVAEQLAADPKEVVTLHKVQTGEGAL